MLKLVRLRGQRAVTERLKVQGMPRDVLRQAPFDPKLHVVSIASEIEGFKVRRVKKAKQLESLDILMGDPLCSNYILCIAGNPSDSKALLTGAMLMERAFTLHTENRRPNGSKELPLWHRVYGGFNDSLREGFTRNPEGAANPSLLILSNITTDSTAAKMETVRDLIVHYDTIPRIVIVSGTDPITFCRRHLRINPHHCLNISTSHRVAL